MTLKTLIQELSVINPDLIAEEGFSTPHSYLGYYEDISFCPARCVSVKDMLKSAQDAVGQTFVGWKGGEFTMTLDTEVWIAEEGNTTDSGESLTTDQLHLMIYGYAAPKAVIAKELTSVSRQGNLSTKIKLGPEWAGKQVVVTISEA